MIHFDAMDVNEGSMQRGHSDQNNLLSANEILVLCSFFYLSIVALYTLVIS